MSQDALIENLISQEKGDALPQEAVTSPEPNNFMKKRRPPVLMIFSVVAIVAGMGTGFGAHRLTAAPTVDTSSLQQVAKEGQVKVGDIFGIKDDKTFKDSAEGYLQKADAAAEGSHELLRPGGVTQTVHLTSSVTDLDKLVGMQVRVKGETFKGQKAGWLMDVGQVEVLQTDAQAPEE